MRASTVVISAVVHVGLAAGLIAVAQNREIRRKAISVAVTSEKKKEAKPKPPPPPKPVVRPPAAHPAAAPVKAAPVAAVARAAVPVTTNLTMSNSDADDTGPGIGLHPRAAPTTTAAPAGAKVASAQSEARLRKTRQDLGPGPAGGEAPCAEEPTKPEPVVKVDINYSLHPQAQADGVEGKIKLRFVVGADGEVTKVDVVSGIEPALDAAIVAAAMRWRFKPAMACGKPVAGGTYVFVARFELGN